VSWTSPPTDHAHEHGEHHLHLPDAAHVVADRRGLTATGAVAIALVLGVIGAAIDVKTGHGLRLVFAHCFIGGSALAAAIVHREDLRAAVMIPPFTYCALAVIGGFLGSTTVAGSFVTKEGVALLDALVLRAPVLFLATGAALLVAVVRKLRQP
jgi:hypothetical protein